MNVSSLELCFFLNETMVKTCSMTLASLSACVCFTIRLPELNAHHSQRLIVIKDLCLNNIILDDLDANRQ